MSNEQKKDTDGTLLLKYVNETASAEERAEVDAWLAEDNSNEEILMQVMRIYHAQHTRQRINRRDSYGALSQVHQRIKRNVGRLFIRRIGVTASLLFGVLGVGSLILQIGIKDDVSSQLINVSTNAGMRSQLALPDGTIVHLNAGSTLVYPSQYDKNERRVRLTGEAYFKVTHRPNQPFTVSVCDDKLTVKVLGTEFNLQAYERDSLVQTTLTEGRVQVGIRGKKGNITMNPFDKMIYNMHTDRLYLEKTNSVQEIAWKDGSLIFKDTPMPEVLRQLTHFYSVEFDVRDEVICGYAFTGTFEHRPLFQILDYMKISSKIDYMSVYPENQDVRKPMIHLKKVDNP